MNRFITAFGSILAVFLGCLLMAGIAGAQAPEKEKAAITAAEQWLGLVDAGKYAGSWTEAAGYFKNAVTQEKWVKSLKAARNSWASSFQEKLNPQRMRPLCRVLRTVSMWLSGSRHPLKIRSQLSRQLPPCSKRIVNGARQATSLNDI